MAVLQGLEVDVVQAVPGPCLEMTYSQYLFFTLQHLTPFRLNVIEVSRHVVGVLAMAPYANTRKERSPV